MTVGFDRFLARSWLDHALTLAGDDLPVAQSRSLLSTYLSEKIRSDAVRRKAAGLLARIWLSPPNRVFPLRDDALFLYEEAEADSLVLHWGMSMAAYPFFGAVVEATGRLLRLHGAATTRQIKRRMYAAYGERSTVSRALQHVLQCMTEWNVLSRADGRAGVYQRAEVITDVSVSVSVWMLEALLFARETDAADLQALLASPVLFPFSLHKVSAKELSTKSGIVVHREGVDRTVVAIKDAEAKELARR